MPAVTSWMESDERLTALEMEETVPHTVTHVLLGRKSSNVPPTSLSHYIFTRQERNKLCFLALHSLLVLSSHCNTAVFQHTNNRDCGGSSAPQWAANQPGVTACQGTVSLWPQLHTPPDFAVPASLVIRRPRDIAVRLYKTAAKYLAFSFLLSVPFFATKGNRHSVWVWRWGRV